MGYTNYWSKVKCTEDQKTKIKQDVKLAFENLPNKEMRENMMVGKLIDIYNGSGENPINSANELWDWLGSDGDTIDFNGDADLEHNHESFCFDLNGRDYWNFCKTARKPYDFFVKVVLLIVDKHTDGELKPCWDGGSKDVADVIDFLKELEIL